MPPPGQPMFPPPPAGIYEYTQILGFKFSDPSIPASLSDETTEIGKIWAATMRTYLELEQTGIVWWALVHGDTSKAKLIVDWKTAAGREQFEASSQFQELSSAWQTVTSTPVSNNAYVFTHNSPGRQAGFASQSGTVSALFTFRFNTPPSASDKEQLDNTFLQFYNTILKSPGGVVSTVGILGWEASLTSYCLAFRYLNIETMQSFLEEDDKARGLAEGLQSYATGGTELEFLETRVYKEGWQGSVDRTKPVDPNAGRWLADVEERKTLGINPLPTHMR
ncbi:hypothetical protein FSARC_2448 [Fusarium sarcochroum]|uniref:Uncharacterized protein n=1 Tax=Fusarium sarcochroum TaxID=1208366 RepID=A0A8H4U6P9_9HYPO|nr:hypothetical protein FSARC_2448 [Fusarium sarcochroum]